MNRYITILLIFTLVACTPNLPRSIPNDIGIPPEELNQKISLLAPKGWNTFKVNESVTIEIINKSKDNILFDANFGTRMFVYEKDTWKEISDKMINVSNEDIVLKPIEIDPTGSVANSLLPELGNIENSTFLRIFVIGYGYKDGVKTDKKVGGFIDINLMP